MRSWLTKSALCHPLTAPVLLVASILAVYYPAVFSGIHPIDDPGIIAKFSASPPLFSILLHSTGYYYRPIVEFSYYLDNWLWGMDPSKMHLENILLHCANSMMVFFLARRILASNDMQILIVPLLAALLFALHPVNVEAVAWIAGRTDPLLALFVLSSSYFWLSWLDVPRWRNLTAAMLLSVAALLTKETALAFSVVVLILVLALPGSATGRQRFKAVGIMITPCVMLMMLAMIVRKGTSALSRFFPGAELHMTQGTWDALVALGFYSRKLIFPFPLNFAITAVHPMYGLLGVALLPALWLVFRRYRLPGVFFVSATLLILPAISVAVKQIAWTPFAERYLYLSTAYFSLGLVGIYGIWQRKITAVLLAFFIILLCGSALGSFQRNLLWKNSESFFQDAVSKSPEFGSLYYSLGGILMQQGEINKAMQAFTAADRLNQRVSMRYSIKSGIMAAMLAKGEYLEARALFFQLFKKKQDAPTDFLELLYQVDSKRLPHLEKKNRHLLVRDLLETLGLLYLRDSNPFWLYRSGQMSLIIGENVKATDYFRRAYCVAPIDAHYRPAALTYLLKLEPDK